MKMLLLVACCLCLLVLPAVAEDAATQPANKLLNGNFATADKGIPANWKITAGEQDITVDEAEHPKDIARSLKVAINSAADSQGSVSQTVKDLPKNTTFVLKGHVKGSAAKIGFLQIKLKNGKTEIKRAKSEENTTDWAEYSLEFSTGEADTVTIECRFSQTEKAKGQAIWFADLQLVSK